MNVNQSVRNVQRKGSLSLINRRFVEFVLSIYCSVYFVDFCQLWLKIKMLVEVHFPLVSLYQSFSLSPFSLSVILSGPVHSVSLTLTFSKFWTDPFGLSLTSHSVVQESKSFSG